MLKVILAIAAAALIGCEVVDDMVAVVDPPPEATHKVNKIRKCAHDSATAADTANYAVCGGAN